MRRLHPHFGAAIEGIAWSEPPGADLAAALRAAFREHRLLCLRATPMAPETFVAFARCLGTPKVQVGGHLEAVPEVSVLDSTYRQAGDKPADMAMVRLTGWHTDDSYLPEPASVTLLQALAVPSSGGQTRFADTHAAYDDLPAAQKKALEGLRAVHRYDCSRARVRATGLSREEADALGEASHPLVRRHDDTGRPALYFNANRTERVEGLERAASDALLDGLHTHMTQPAYQYHHDWREGDILVWDNRCLIHSVNMDFPVGESRRHQRILLEGRRPA
ncbi:MAG: TauD/TfdA family dioxygenase [Proteobacteria bacterium]|nr:TauD/TfdA family dioxygenase [Pseudomonadota bacterium]